MSDTRALAVIRDAPSVSVSLSDVQTMAKAAAESGLFPALRSPEAVMTLMLLCQAEGLHPIQALRRFDIIEGKPGLKADAMLAEFQARGGVVDWVRCDSECVEAVFEAPGAKRPTTVKWMIEDAKRAELAGRPNWKKYPRAMLRARVISEGVRMVMPGVVVGLYAPEEVQDFDDRPRMRIVESQPAPEPTSEPEPQDAIVEVPHEPAPVMASPAQVRALYAALGAINMKKKDDSLAWLSWKLGRKVASSKELTMAECSVCIDAANGGEVPPAEGSAA